MQRRGVALLITLVTIAMLMVIIAALFILLDEARKESVDTSALIQSDLYYKNISDYIKHADNKNKKALFETPHQILNEEGIMAMKMECKPITSGVNINWLAYENDPQMHANYAIIRELFDAIALKYAILDMGKLEEMILNEIKSKEDYIPASQSKLYQKSAIISFLQFQQILTRYALESDDRHVYQVPWRKLFSFLPEAGSINGDYMSAELVALLFDQDQDLVQSEWKAGEGALQKFVETYRPDIYYAYRQVFVENLKYTHCHVTYLYKKEHYAFSFDTIGEEVEHFEYFGRQ